MNTLFEHVIRPTLRGVGQVALINNAATGLLLLVALFFHDLTTHNLLESPWTRVQHSLTFATLIGALSSLLVARILSVESEAINQGLYGYNGALVGIACMTFFSPNSLLLVLIVLGGGATSLIMRFWRWRVSPFTFPFLSIIAMIFFAADWLGLTLKGGSLLIEETSHLSYFSHAMFNGIGQVLFQQGLVFSLVVLFAIAIHSMNTSIWAVLGAGFGLTTAFILSLVGGEASLDLMTLSHNEQAVHIMYQGLFGFNGALVALALSQISGMSKPAIFAGIGLASTLAYVGILLKLTLLTFPFVFSAWIVITIVNTFNTEPRTQEKSAG
ncbi:urea transporter [Vibrio sp. 10N.261.55.A7]|uniref:urea transporter n=1 Tax=Vibrio sp. 10N.261.55.A7 TaxID=1880851 RepID=UPI000C837BEF|nr:urea transporter [Vibrio sp. 10N.261.55.A7]PMJ92768.1 hypothetical protein BCU12_07055 [Vibrio sp. 10N.261.55.A7]